MAIKSPPSPPPPPPPPPPLPSSTVSPLLSPTLEVLLEDSKGNVELGQENMNPLAKISFFNDMSKIFYVTNTFLQPQLQKGPTCGLVALSIASLISERFVEVDEIFQEAVLQGFTKQGEMFNVQSLAYLAEKCCKFNTRILSGGIGNHLFCIIRSLINKNLILVPYDCDVNHLPCLKNGGKAHWAVVSGFAIKKLTEGEETVTESDVVLINDDYNKCDCKTVQNNCNCDPENDLVFFNYNKNLYASKKPAEEILNLNKAEFAAIFLIGLQGKSKRLGVWEFTNFAESNDNLMQFSFDRDSESYVLPEGGLEQGLKGQAIILEPKK